MPNESVETFFSRIPRTTSFLAVFDSEYLHPAPDDWIVVIGDIQSSTRAVLEGRYKEVNMIGGAVLSAIINATRPYDVPFVFGGDGGEALIPEALGPQVEAALVRTRTLAREDFGLTLRIGFVSVAEIRILGADVLVSRYSLSPGNDLAIFGGGGLELADSLIKRDVNADQYAVPDYDLEGQPDLTGLSCRWEPLEAQRGCILCVLVRPLGETFGKRRAVVKRVLNSLGSIIGPELAEASPVTEQNMRFRWPPKGLWAEAKATRGTRSRWIRYFEVLFGSFSQLVLERFDLKGGAYDAPIYRNELRQNSDFRRFDDVLRLVLDCTPNQVQGIRDTLEHEHAIGELDFGIFEAEQALMTCLLFSLEQSSHLHFIDGDEGGFWAAASAFKGAATDC